MRSDLMGSIFPLHLPPSLSRGSPFLGFCNVEDRMEKQREQFAKCVCRTQSSPCAIWVSSPREIAWNVYVLCSIEISLRNTQINQVSSSLSVHKHRRLKYFYRRLSVQLKHSYRAVTWSDSGIVQINTGQKEALIRLPVNR